ncbi:TPA: fimbria/pilus outer membrane usher protein, partial [Escherichia coli]
EQYQGGRIVIGNSYINSELFDNFPFKGVKFSSDDSMLDSSFSEFTPSIRGIAHSPSIVTVKQNGNIVLQKEVPAGVFEIDDIPYNFGGDYIIEVNGSDGVKNTFTQANASLPFLQKEGRTNHYLALGKLRHQYGTDTYEPNFILYHIAKGLRFGNTLHHGGIISNEYKSILFGGGTYHPYLGAFSVDYTFSEREDRKYEGRGRGDKFEFSYSRNIDLTSANLSMHMNIFDKDYLNFQEHAYSFNGNANTYEKTKRNFGVRLTQPI